MTDKLELKSSHEVVYTVDVADVDSIFHGKPIDPDILTVVMKDGKRLYCDEVCHIDSLQEEPVSKGYRERYKRIAQSEEFKKTYKGMSVGEVMHVEGEESVWIKELQDKLDSLSKEDFEKVWSKYGQYGKSEESVSDDLEKAAVNAFKQIVDSDKNNFLEIFRAGAKWQKEQMVAKAIDGVVTFDYYDSGNKTYGCVAHDSFCLEDFGLKDRDKVKVIVIKEK